MDNIDLFPLFLVVGDFLLFGLIGMKKWQEFKETLASIGLVFVIGEVIFPRNINLFPVEGVILVMTFISLSGYLAGRLARVMYYDRKLIKNKL